MKTNSIFYVLFFALIFSVKVNAQIQGSQILPSGINTISNTLNVNNINIEGVNQFLDFHATSPTWQGMRFFDASSFEGGIFYRTVDEGVNLASGTSADGLRYNFANNNASLGASFLEQAGKFTIKNNSNLAYPQLNLVEAGDDFARLQFSNDQGVDFWQMTGRANGTEPKINFSYNKAGLDSTIMTIDGENYRVGIGKSTPLYSLHVEEERTTSAGGIIYAENTNVGSGDARALMGVSTPEDGWGYGVQGTGGYRGVYGLGQGGAYTGTTIGVYAIANGTAGTRTGLYATASGGTTNNWAGYFASGNVYITNELRIGDTGGADGYKVAVNGKMICEELKVEDSGVWPDYVFEKEYELKSLEEVEASINENGHLPGIPSAAQITEDGGYHVGDMQRRTIEKVEELTLYLIESNKQMKALQTQNELLQKQNEALLKRVEKLENE